MGTAHGSKTIRYLAKGEDGKDSVRYYIDFNPSSYVIMRKKDNTVYPSSITATGMKQIGDSDPIEASDCIVSYSMKRINTPIESWLPSSSNEISATIPSDIEYIMFRITKNNITMYQSTLLVVEDGTDGSDGKPGQDGEDGENAIIYEVGFTIRNNSVTPATSYNITSGIPCDAYGNMKHGPTLRATIYKIDGSTRSEYTARISVNAYNSSGVATQSHTRVDTYIGFAPRASEVRVNVVAQDPDTLDTLVEADIFKIYDGAAGNQGIQGCVYRQTEWKSGVEYRNDANLDAPAEGEQYRYIDVVGVMEGESTYWFQCKLTHQSSSSNKPSTATTSVYWTQLNNLAPTYTPFLLADNAELSLIGTRQILVKDISDKETKVVMGFTGRAEVEGEDTGICAWVGESPTNANNTLVIKKDGTIMTRATFSVKAVELGILNTKEIPDPDSADNDLTLYPYIQNNTYNFYGTGENYGEYSIVIPYISTYNTTNEFQLSDGVEFSFFNQPVMRQDDGVPELIANNIKIYSENPIIWNKRFADTLYHAGGSMDWDTNGIVNSLTIAPHGMLRMRAVRRQVYDPNGVFTGSYDIFWIILNANDFYAYSIQIDGYGFNAGAVSKSISTDVSLRHKMCKGIDKSEINKAENELYTTTYNETIHS